MRSAVAVTIEVCCWLALQFFFCFSPVWAEDVSRAADSKPGAASSAPSGRKMKQMLDLKSGDNKGPLYIKSASLTLEAKQRMFVYKGNVEITQGDMLITADTVTGYYDEQNQMDKVIAQGNVVITRGEELRASSNRAIYLVKEATIELTEGPDLSHHGSDLTADRVMIYVDEDRSEAFGEVRVKVVQTGSGQGDMLSGFKSKSDKSSEGAE